MHGSLEVLTRKPEVASKFPTDLHHIINWNTIFLQNRRIKHCDKLEEQIQLHVK